MQHRMLFKGSTGTERCQEQYLTGWKSLQWPQSPSEAIFHQRAQSAPPRPLGMSKYSGRDRVNECVTFAHSLAELSMSYEGMFINMNTSCKDKYVPLRPFSHLFQDGVSSEICNCIFKILIQFDTW